MTHRVAFRAERFFAPIVHFLVVVAAIYFGKPILVPLVVAALLAFLLSPAVSSLQRMGLPRSCSVVLAVGLTTCVLGTVGWALATQLAALAQDLPQYRTNIRQKIADLRGMSKDSALEKVQETVAQVSEEFNKASESVESNSEQWKEATSSLRRPWAIPVTVEGEKGTIDIGMVPSMVQPLLRPFASIGIAIVLVVFVLIRQDDLRNRMLRIVAQGHLALTTKVIDEIGTRISRYLVIQLLINTTFGLAIGIGLSVIGLPHALLWGLLATALRYLPYVGPWMAAAAPLAISVIAFPGWWEPLLVAALFITLELSINSFLEPLLYSRGVGVSEVAVLVSAAFWAWLWGPLGLILSTPITVCVVVLGHYLPQLQCFAILLGDDPVLEPAVQFYQRLLSGDRWSAMRLFNEEHIHRSRQDVLDRIILPCLALAQEEYERGELGEEDRERVTDHLRTIFKETHGTPPSGGDAEGEAGARRRIAIYGCPAQSDADLLGLELFAGLLNKEKYSLKIGSREMLCSEVLQQVEQCEADLVCIAAIPPGGMAQVRYLCRRLRQRFPELKIIVGRWGYAGPADEARKAFEPHGADHVVRTFAEALRQVHSWAQFLAHRVGASTASGSTEVAWGHTSNATSRVGPEYTRQTAGCAPPTGRSLQGKGTFEPGHLR